MEALQISKGNNAYFQSLSLGDRSVASNNTGKLFFIFLKVKRTTGASLIFVKSNAMGVKICWKKAY